MTLLAMLCLALRGCLPACAARREPIDVVLLLDNSGSMARQPNASGSDERFMRVTAVQYLLEKMAPGDRAAVVTFDSRVHTDSVASTLTDVAEAGRRAPFDAGIVKLTDTPEYSTDMAAGLKAAEHVFLAARGEKRRRFLIFLTDGAPNADPKDRAAVAANQPDALVKTAGQLAHSERITLHTIGLGTLDKEGGIDPQALLQRMALAGGGTFSRVVEAGTLPDVFSAIFAQIVGHEVTHTVRAGPPQTFTVAPGTANLRVIAASDTAQTIHLTGPDGHIESVHTVAPLLPGKQTATLAVAAPGARPGQWQVAVDRGAVEIAWEPNFVAVVRSPVENARVAPHQAVQIVAEIHAKSGAAALNLPGSRMEIVGGGNEQIPLVRMTPDPAHPGRFHALIESGDAGAQELLVRCYRRGEFGEEEGGPARPVLQVTPLPHLEVTSPTPDAAFVVRQKVPLAGHLTLNGQPLMALPPELHLTAALQTPAGRTDLPLLLDANGNFQNAPNAGDRPGPAMLTVTLAGEVNGGPVVPQRVIIPFSLAPQPFIRLAWRLNVPRTRKRDALLTMDPDERLSLPVDVVCAAPTPQPVRFHMSGMSGMGGNAPDTVWTIPAQQPETVRNLMISPGHIAPGNYDLDIVTQAGEAGVLSNNPPLHVHVHVRSWLERNRWWFYPALVLLFLLIVSGIAFASWWTRREAWRKQRMRAVLNQVYVQVPGTQQKFRPDNPLPRFWFTAGGKGSDVELRVNSEPLFEEPVMRISVQWNRKANGPQVRVTPTGTSTMFADRNGALLQGDVVPTEGDTMFYVDPAHVLVAVLSELT